MITTPINQQEKDAIAAWDDFYGNHETEIDGTELQDEFDGDDHPTITTGKLFEEELWRSMSIGFLIGKGIHPIRAYLLAIECIRC